MSCNKKSRRDKFIFVRNKSKNGSVYKIHIQNDDKIYFNVVAKFIEYEGKQKRYTKFKNEINSLNKIEDIEESINIIDKNGQRMFLKIKIKRGI